MHRPTLPGRTSLFTAAGLTLFAALSLVAAPSAHSAQIPLERVQVGDIDLATPSGQRQLARRIDAAIRSVCERPNRGLPRTRATVRGIETCRAAALQSAQRQLAALGVRPEVRAAQSR